MTRTSALWENRTMTNMYRIDNRTTVLNHFSISTPYFVHDHQDEFDLLLHARVRSGDYLETVAPEIDRIAQSPALQQMPESAELERLVRELLKANKSFKVVPKPRT